MKMRVCVQSCIILFNFFYSISKHLRNKRILKTHERMFEIIKIALIRNLELNYKIVGIPGCGKPALFVCMRHLKLTFVIKKNILNVPSLVCRVL